MEIVETYWLLFITFFKIGLFAFGGGYAVISLIKHDIVDVNGWMSSSDFTDIVAISQMTPGPIGINSATYVGYTVSGNILGAGIATFAICLPSFIIMLMLCRFFFKLQGNKYLNYIFTSLRPATIGLIAAASLVLMNRENFIDYKSILIFAAVFIASFRFKLHPILLIVMAGITGVILY